MGNVTSTVDHGIVCDCGHEESDHCFAGGCMKCVSTPLKAACECYSQKRLRKRGQKQPNDNHTSSATS